MQLIFEKKSNEITVKMVTGTVAVDFSYTAMIQQLLKKNKFEDTQYRSLSDEEKKRIEEMLKKINIAVQDQEK
jgi:cobalamin biosynthesis Co2+ chelatase CbiK